MLFTKPALALGSAPLVLLVSAQEPVDAVHHPLIPALSKVPAVTTNLMPRSLDKRCSGSCEECFGTGYILCPDSSLYCYLPGDSYYGLDSCPGSSDSSASAGATSAASATVPAASATSISGIDDICSQVGATCKSCFGPTYLECPDGYHCYDPNDPNYNTCPDDGSSSSNSTGSTCEDQYGAGSQPCGTDSCYNPGQGDVCCQDGYHCEGGDTCSSNVGKCCTAGSTDSSCSGSSSGGGGGGGAASSSSPAQATTPATSGGGDSGGGLVPAVATTATSHGVVSTASPLSDASPMGRGKAKALVMAVGVGALVL